MNRRDGGRSSDSLRRLAFVDILVRWFGRARPKDLALGLGLSDATAGRVLSGFAGAHPGLVRHADHERGYHRIGDEPGSDRATEALMFLRGQSLANRYADGAGVWCGVDIEDADAGVVPPVDALVLSGFLRALAERRTIAIRYAGRGSASDMVVSPHRLVHALHRYHVRCVDHRDGRFKDIVLSRVVSAAPSDADFLPNRDPEWGAAVTLSFRVNPALSPAMNHSVHNEWRLAKGASLELGCRVALAKYVTRRMTMPSTDGPARWIPSDNQTAGFIRSDPR